jgi:hypothetical protein
MTRRQRRAEWRKKVGELAQSKQALESGWDRAERRRRAKTLWTASTPNVTRVSPGYGHWMSERIAAMQIGLMALCWR